MTPEYLKECVQRVRWTGESAKQALGDDLAGMSIIDVVCDNIRTLNTLDAKRVILLSGIYSHGGMSKRIKDEIFSWVMELK